MKNSISNQLKRLKKDFNVSAQEILLSPEIRRFCQSKAKTLSRRYFNNIRVSLVKNCDAVAYTDNANVVINVGADNSYLNFKEYKITKLIKIVLGFLVHECAHILYTDFAAFNDAANDIKQGIIPKQFNNPKNEEIKKFLNQTEEISSISRNWTIKTLHILNNVIEDGHIERRIIEEYPGEPKRSILAVRNERFKETPKPEEIWKDFDENSDKWSVRISTLFTYLFLRFAHYGIGVKNDIEYIDTSQKEEIINLFEQCTDLLEKAVLDKDASKRLSLSWDVFCKVFDYIKPTEESLEQAAENKRKLEEMLEQLAESEQSGNNGNSSNSSEKNSKKPLDKSDGKLKSSKNSSSESGKPKNPEDSSSNKDSSKGSGSDSKDSPENGEEKQSKQNKGSKDASEKEKNGPDSDDSKENDENKEDSEKSEEAKTNSETESDSDSTADEKENTSEPDFNSSENENVEEDGSDDEISEELTASINEAVKQATKSVLEEKASSQDSRATEQFAKEFFANQSGSCDRNIKVKVTRPDKHIDDNANYRSIVQKNQSSINRAKNLIEKVLKEEVVNKTLKGNYVGKINSSQFGRKDLRYWDRKILPKEKSLAVGLLIDESGSMWCSDRWKAARETAIVLYEFCRALGVPVCIYGHTADEHGYDLNLLKYKDFDFNNHAVISQDLMKIKARTNNRDSAANAIVCQILSERPEKQKLFIVISDGKPNAWRYGGKAAKDEIKAIKKKYSAFQVTTFAAAIGADKKDIHECYQDGFLDITDLKKLPENLLRLVKAYLQ